MSEMNKATVAPRVAVQLQADRIDKYDRITVSLHWLTAALVVALFALAITFNYLGRGTPLRHNLQLVHVSLGIMLAAIMITRVTWRATGGRRLPDLRSRTRDFWQGRCISRFTPC
jgi:cytochrome b561